MNTPNTKGRATTTRRMKTTNTSNNENNKTTVDLRIDGGKITEYYTFISEIKNSNSPAVVSIL